MAKGHDILLVQKSPQIPEGLRESLQSRGFITHVVPVEEDIAKVAPKLNQPILLVYCEEKTQEVARTIRRLCEMTAAHMLPSIIVGQEIDQFESKLNEHFLLATTIVTPCSSMDILQAIEYIVRFYDKFTKKVSDAKAKAPQARTSEGQATTRTNRMYEDFRSIPDLVFGKLLELNILERSLRGEEYARIVRLEPLAQKDYLPAHQGVRGLFEDFTGQVHPWTRNHLHRTCFLADLIFEALNFSKEARENGRIAAALFAWSFGAHRKDVLRKNYLDSAHGDVRRELGSLIKDSAMRVATELHLPMPGNIIAALARLIAREEVPSESTDSLLASSIMAADLVDRLCTRAGLFQPQVAYFVMNTLKTAAMRDLHPLVLCCSVKILAEGISATSSALSISKKLRKNPKLLEAARLQQEMPIGSDEIKVSITSLSPGMRISRPVMTFDGKEILKEDIILDEDLIWRIWRLAALRPVNGPVIIVSDA